MLTRGTPYITAMTDKEIHFVKQPVASDPWRTAAAWDDNLWMFHYMPVAKDEICVKIADYQYVGFDIAGGICLG